MISDDAAGGRRGLRAAPTAELFGAIHDAYGIDPTGNMVDLGGSSSLNLLVNNGNDRHVVRVYRPYVTADRLRAIQLVRRKLAASGAPCAELVPTRDGAPWLHFAGRLVEAERYVEHDAGMDAWERLEIGLPVLGRMHTILRDLAVGPDGRTAMFANAIDPSDALERTLAGTRRIRGWNPSPAEVRLAEMAEELAHQVSSAEQHFSAQMPRQLVHGDFWDNNVFFQDGRLILVSDFDFMGERARIDDLALTLYFACLEHPQEAHSGEQLHRLSRLVDAYDAGLDEPLTGSERAALPLAIARQALWSIAVWVALLDDEKTARRHAAGAFSELVWALGVVREVERWQAAFA